MRKIHQSSTDSPHKGLVIRKAFLGPDIIKYIKGKFCEESQPWSVDSPHKGPAMREALWWMTSSLCQPPQRTAGRLVWSVACFLWGMARCTRIPHHCTRHCVHPWEIGHMAEVIFDNCGRHNSYSPLFTFALAVFVRSKMGVWKLFQYFVWFIHVNEWFFEYVIFSTRQCCRFGFVNRPLSIKWCRPCEKRSSQKIEVSHVGNPLHRDKLDNFAQFSGNPTQWSIFWYIDISMQDRSRYCSLALNHRYDLNCEVELVM